MIARLYRNRHPDKTTGILLVNDVEFETLELPWRDNKLSISCIPDGEYRCKVDYSNNKNRNVIELLYEDTKPRSQIQIHVATKTSQLKGCIGVKTKELELALFSLLSPCGVIRIKTID